MTTLDGHRMSKAMVNSELARDRGLPLGRRLAAYDDAIGALQSLDDLGSHEENQRAWNWMVQLQEEQATLGEG